MEIINPNQNQTKKPKSNYNGNKRINTRKSTANKKQGLQTPKDKGYVIPKITEEDLNRTYITTLGDLIKLLDYGVNHDSIVLPTQKLTRAISDPVLKKNFLIGYFQNEMPILIDKVLSKKCTENYTEITPEYIVRKTAEYLANNFINSNHIYLEM